MVHQITCNDIAPDCTNHYYVIKRYDLLSHYKTCSFIWFMIRHCFSPIKTNVWVIQYISLWCCSDFGLTV